MPTLRSESAPRRSSRVVQAEQAAAKAKEAASAASKKARPAAKKAGKVVKKTAAKAKTAVRKIVVKPAAKKVAKAAGVDVKEDEDEVNKAKPTSRKRKADDAEGDNDEKENSKKQKKDESVSGKYTVGDVVEDVVLRNEDDKEVSLESLYKEKGLVIFSYPKADTPGCTNQACGYRDIHSEFSGLGYGVYGLSKDKPTAQLKWKTKHTLSYSLLCDPEDKLLKKLGATAANKRCHWVIGKGGKLLEAAIGLDFIKSIKDDGAADEKEAE
ncbi:peroxiredoxin Q/BCP [Rhodotorula toruloides]|uniref:thioredoxin-dependent peroxiredoxin n=1 Tax=Rhodotorula toruloides TaxID=5286 RepID=A0A511KJB9_RHOTO|nr:peroxiredoxin Q/BCP [Rhodotorula toruloides]